MKQNDGHQVIVTGAGETLKKPDDMPAELHGEPAHDWKSKALELLSVSTRRRKIIRRLVKERGPLLRESKAFNEISQAFDDYHKGRKRSKAVSPDATSDAAPANTQKSQ